MKRVILCYKEHDKMFIWYYYAYSISKAILDLDPNLCQNFLFFVTSSILHIETCMIPLSKAVHKGFISFLTPKSFELFMGTLTLWPKNWKKLTFFACNCVISSHTIKCNTSFESLYEGLHFFLLHWWAMSNKWGHYDLKAWKFDDLTVLCAVWFTYLFWES